MKSTIFFLWVFFILNVNFAQTNKVHFLKGKQVFNNNFETLTFSKEELNKGRFKNSCYRFVQFKKIPTQEQIKALKIKGIELLEYIPDNTYISSIYIKTKKEDLASFGIVSIQEIEKYYKMSDRVLDKDYPSWAINNGEVSLIIHSFKNIKAEIFKEELLYFGVKIREEFPLANMSVITIKQSEVESLSELSFISYIDVVPAPGKPESDDGRDLHRASVIDVDYFGGRKYNGSGISIAINDDGFVGPHIDFKGRVDQTEVAGDFTGDHGDMTAGIAGGSGNLNPKIRGMATGSFLHIRDYSSSMGGTIPLYLNDNVLVFSSSYSNGCNEAYNSITRLVDQEIYNNESLMQVFSAGNNNGSDCGYGAGSNWGNITGGHKAGKNVIATANLNSNDNIAGSSSRGPASDGRIKPDLSAHGAGQMSTDPNNTYASGGGTSAAAPGVAGVLAQLHHAYRELYGTTAPSALLKAVLLTTANDLGNTGPDFIFGWGKINAKKAVQLLEDNRFFNANISSGISTGHNINVPNGVKKVRVMVYWADREATTLASQALVNDIDIQITDPSSIIHYPWVLDHTPNPTTLGTPAVRGVDHLNNMEEVEIDNPTAGNYVLSVNGTTIPFGSQKYYVVYEFIYNTIDLIHPIGGEGLLPGTTERIHWDAEGSNGGFKLEYSIDNGLNWNVIVNNLNGSIRFYNWVVPNVLTGEARVRVTRGGLIGESHVNFTIMEKPNNLRVTKVCLGNSEVKIEWDVVPGATAYDVFLLGAKYMDSVGTTSALNYTVTVPNINEENWFSVRARGVNNAVSLRQIAIPFDGMSNGACFLSCSSDHDAGVREIVSPSDVVSICGGGASIQVDVVLENIGLYTESNFNVFYKFGSNSIVSNTVSSSLISGGTVAFSFPVFTESTDGVYELKVWTSLNLDNTICNDTLIKEVKVEQAWGGFPYVENFQSTFQPKYTIENFDNSKTWESTFVVGTNGITTRAMYVDNYGYNSPGAIDQLNIQTLDLTHVVGSALLNFDVAYREYSSGNKDSLKVQLSSDCGVSYQTIYQKTGSDLANGVSVPSRWEPSNSTDWRTESIDLSTFVGGIVRIRFVNVCDYGQNLYLDNINIQANSLPISEFHYTLTSLCSHSVDFFDASHNDPTQWLWNFGDGTTSSLQNPSHIYANIGTYDVSLQTTNALGSDFEVSQVVMESVLSNYPIVEDFESTTTYPFFARVVNNDNLTTWNFTDVIGAFGISTKAMMINNLNYSSIGEEDFIEFQTIDLTQFPSNSNAMLYFDISYRKYSPTYSDSLRIDVSTDCGQTFTSVFFKGGDDISSGADVTAQWSPTSVEDWVVDSVDLNSFIGEEITIRMANICGYGQDLYIDNVNVKTIGTFASSSNSNFELKYQLTPNPSNGELNLLFKKVLTEDIKVKIYSLDGRLVRESILFKGESQKQFNFKSLASATYIMRLKSKKFTTSERIVLK